MENGPSRLELTQRFFFEAAHTLHRAVEAKGSLRVHGHTYHAEVTVGGIPNAGSGMVVDLAHLRAEIAILREHLDHRLLDEVESLGPATLENLCIYIRAALESRVPQLCAVTVERQASGDRCCMRWD